MLRKYFFAVAMVLLTATASQAAVMITQSLSATQPSIQAGGVNLIAYDVHAVSDDGTILNGVNNPTTVANLGGMGLHQVWSTLLDSPTPTRQEQLTAAATWSDTWREYDSYWFFENANSLGVGGAFTETNSHAGGAVLPPNALGAPNTGFGQFGFSTISASKGYTIASGQQGTTINLGQFVIKDQESVLLSLGILDNTGGNTRLNDQCIGANCGGPPDDFMVNDLFLGGRLPGQIVSGGPLPTNATVADIAWSLVSLVGPDGPEVGASVDPLTGVFTWDSAPTDSRGGYTATIQGVNSGDPTGTDNGLLTFNLVPEPASITLLGLALVGAIGFIRRR